MVLPQNNFSVSDRGRRISQRCGAWLQQRSAFFSKSDQLHLYPYKYCFQTCGNASHNSSLPGDAQASNHRALTAWNYYFVWSQIKLSFFYKFPENCGDGKAQISSCVLVIPKSLGKKDLYLWGTLLCLLYFYIHYPALVMCYSPKWFTFQGMKWIQMISVKNTRKVDFFCFPAV